jgi:threonine/homoserine/homoserine lactone efflux protein
VLKTGIGHGVKKGYLAATGVFIGDAVLMFLAWAGVAALIQTTPVLFNIVRYLGAFLCSGWGQNALVGGEPPKTLRAAPNLPV